MGNSQKLSWRAFRFHPGTRLWESRTLCLDVVKTSSVEMNFVAIGIAAFVGILLGGFWFSPIAFFPVWWKFLGKKPEDQTGTDNMVVVFGSTFIAAILQAIVMAVFISLAEQATGAMDTFTGLAVGALVGVGFAATASLGHHLFGGFPIKAWVLEAGQDIVSLAVMGAIIASF